MSRRSKKKEAQQSTSQGQFSPSPPMGGYQVFDLQVFDGKGHAGSVSYQRDSAGRERYKLRRGRDWHANLPHTGH